MEKCNGKMQKGAHQEGKDTGGAPADMKEGIVFH